MVARGACPTVLGSHDYKFPPRQRVLVSTEIVRSLCDSPDLTLHTLLSDQVGRARCATHVDNFRVAS